MSAVQTCGHDRETPDGTLRTCTRCGKESLMDAANFWRQKGSHGGFMRQCKACAGRSGEPSKRQRTRQRRLHLESVRAPVSMAQPGRCSFCQSRNGFEGGRCIICGQAHR